VGYDFYGIMLDSWKHYDTEIVLSGLVLQVMVVIRLRDWIGLLVVVGLGVVG